MVHRGEVVKKEIESSGIPISKLAQKLKINRMTLYNKLDQPEMDLELVKRIGQIINFDFSIYFKELKPTFSESESLPENVEDLKKIINYKNLEIRKLKDEIIQLSLKVIKLMEDKIKYMNEK